MNVYKRGGVYWLRFTYKGQLFRKSTHLMNAQKARDYASAYRTKLINGEVGIQERKPVPSFSKAMKEFLAWSEQEHKAHPRTHHRYETSAVALKRYYKDSQLDQITPEDVEKFKTSRARQKSPRTKRVVRPATVNRELACLKALFNFAIKGDIVVKNPVSRVKFLNEDNEQVRVITPDEQRLYLMAASQPLRDIATLMLETGMRPEEVYRIECSNVHIEANEPYIFNPFGKTKAAKRRVPLNKIALEVVRGRLTKAKGTFLFPGRGVGDQPIVKVNNAHVSAVKRSKVDRFTLYTLRHTWATRAAQAGVDLVTLASLLGHSRIQMVLRYAHPTQEHQFAAMRKIEEYSVVK